MKSKISITFLFLCVFSQLLFAFSVQQFTAPVISFQADISSSGNFFSGTSDGFVTKWNADGSGDVYQMSDISIKLIAVHPDVARNEIAVYETDSFGIHRISVWNWQTKTRKYAKRLSDAVVSLSYSAKGTYVMIGTTSMNGLLFLDGESGVQRVPLSDPTGIVTLAVTSASEASLITYAQSGLITYSDLTTGKIKAQFPTEANLHQAILHANNLSLTGVKGGFIYTINATTGKIKGTYAVPDGFLVTNPTDTHITYIDFENGLYTITGDIVDIQYCVLPSDTIQTALRIKDSLYVGGKSGAVYKASIDFSGVPKVPTVLTGKNQLYIRDIASDGDLFYFLTSKGIYTSTYENSTLQLLTNFADATNLFAFGGNVYTWSKNQTQPIYQNGLVLYTPKKQITGLSYTADSKLLIIENEATVYVFDIPSKKIVFTYTGTGFQDAFLTGDFLYVAKIAQTSDDPAVLRIHTKTSETVPLGVNGDIVYRIVPYQDKHAFVGLKITLTQNQKNTEVFEYDINSNTYTKLMSISDEDLNAFLFPTTTYIFTNAGKSNITAIDYMQGKFYRLARSQALAKKMIASNLSFVTQNSDGSVSWYDSFTNSLLGNWYISVDGKWVF